MKVGLAEHDLNIEMMINDNNILVIMFFLEDRHNYLS